MKGYVAALSALALLAGVGLAHAEEARGTLQEVNEAERTIVLEDGTTFILAEGVSIEGLEPGTEVTVSFEMEGGDRVADSITRQEQ